MVLDPRGTYTDQPHVSSSLLCSQESSGEREALAKSVEHAQRRRSLRLIASVGRLPRDDDRNVGVAGGHNADTAKVPRMQLIVGAVMCGNSEKDRPSYDTDGEDCGGGNASGLFPVGKGRQEEHEYQCDHIRWDGE